MKKVGWAGKPTKTKRNVGWGFYPNKIKGFEMTLVEKMSELFLFDTAHKCPIIGTDEAGRGPGAGPVFAAAVHFENIDKNLSDLLIELNDSKKLTHKKREELYHIIKENSVYSIQSCSVEEIEKMNILQASLFAMKKACTDVLSQCNMKNCKILIDGNKLIPKFEHAQEKIVKGDGRSASIAAASILAKVERDNFMQKLHLEFPQYCWDKNKGYLTAEHLNAIEEHGITKWHRKKFLRNIIERKQLSLF